MYILYMVVIILYVVKTNLMKLHHKAGFSISSSHTIKTIYLKPHFASSLQALWTILTDTEGTDQCNSKKGTMQEQNDKF